ncbi:hypothetical protein [Myxacorys almedinensis]|uniref:Uncharacterized protein n=1 Tax=Myxacorys almedinensis A TaxID=2690445 RepID=A0A8J7Z5E2_9CYAN|nr:hypothetical protein [Myxacorys almedinensis]NDJ18413.1 hypothetical protein [Myxacorys almedinensis A]
MQNANHSGQAVPSSPPAYAPSVPISLYREVTAELQATKTTLDAIKQQNQQLVQQNQRLHHEIEKAVQSALNLRQAAIGVSRLAEVNMAAQDSSKPMSRFEGLSKVDVAPVAAPATFRAPTLAPKSISFDSPFPAETLVTEEDSKPRRKVSLESESAGNSLGGWWLGVAIALIVVTAFGAGFLIVRPLLPSSSK